MAEKDLLLGNEKIEAASEWLQKEPTQETLAIALSTVRRRMKEGGQLIVAIEPSLGNNYQVQAMELENGEKWLPAYTSFDEQLLGGGQVMSTFTADIEKLLNMALEQEGLAGLLINPWNKTLRLDKQLLQIIKGV